MQCENPTSSLTVGWKSQGKLMVRVINRFVLSQTFPSPVQTPKRHVSSNQIRVLSHKQGNKTYVLQPQRQLAIEITGETLAPCPLLSI